MSQVRLAVIAAGALGMVKSAKNIFVDTQLMSAVDASFRESEVAVVLATAS